MCVYAQTRTQTQTRAPWSSPSLPRDAQRAFRLRPSSKAAKESTILSVCRLSVSRFFEDPLLLSPPSDHFFFAWLGASNAGGPRLAACPFSAQRPFRCARPRAVATGSCATSPPPPLHEDFMNKRMSFCATWVGEGVVRELSHTCPGARVLPTAVYACMPCMCVCACIHACYAYMFSTIWGVFCYSR